MIGDVHPVADEVAKFDFDFVSGYTLRIVWSDLETWDATTQAPRYDFSRIDTTLENLRRRGKRMTLELFVTQAPAYILAQPNVATWLNPNPNQGGIQVVPWDATALHAYQALIQALANHTVAGTSWRLADHPALESVDAPIIGLQGLRELSNTLINHPGYTREGFVQSVVDSVATSRNAFPLKFGFLAFFAMSDATSNPALDDAVYTRLTSEFNLPGKPSLGFFQETLSDLGPQPSTLGKILAKAAPETYVMFQALRPWTLKAGTPRPREIASATPLAGLELAWANYGATYVELYGADILNSDNTSGLRSWNTFLNAVGAVRASTAAPQLHNLGSDGFRLIWDASPYLNYRIQQSTDLIGWTTLGTTEPLNGNVPVPVPNAPPRIFYRVEIIAPVR